MRGLLREAPEPLKPPTVNLRALKGTWSAEDEESADEEESEEDEAVSAEATEVVVVLAVL